MHSPTDSDHTVEPQVQGLQRVLSSWDATFIIVGVIIGAGIFLRIPSWVALNVPNPTWMLAVWVLGGLLTLIGALCYAELSAAFPVTGGDYAYLSRAYGPSAGFLYGWSQFVIVRTGNIALLALLFGTHVAGLVSADVQSDPDLGTALAILAIVLLTSVNIVGIRPGTDLQNLVTSVKLIALGALIVVPPILGADRQVNVASVEPRTPEEGALLAGLATAMVLVLWAYGGWSESVLVAGEVKDPRKSLPRSIIRSAVLCTVLYVLANLSYLSVLGVDGMAELARPETIASPGRPDGVPPPAPGGSIHPQGVAEKAISVASGRVSRELVSLLVAISVLGGLNGLILTGARITYAAAQDHPLFAWLGRPNERYRTPATALALQAFWAVGLVLVFRQDLESMLYYMGFAVWLFYGMAGISLFVLRRRFPDIPRPFRTWGYPVTPVIFVVQCFAMMAVSFLKFPRGSLYCAGLILLGLPIYLAFSHSAPSPPETSR